MEVTEIMTKYWALLPLIILILSACGSTPEIPCGSDVTWEQAIEILNQGDVEQVFQTHSLAVELLLKDGCTYNTVEPVIDDIFTEVEKCGAPCAGIMLATE